MTQPKSLPYSEAMHRPPAGTVPFGEPARTEDERTGKVAGAYVAAVPLPLGDAFHLAGALGKMKIVDFSLRLDTRYTFWSGMTGGLFVALAYFGTDQSQVQRYLSGRSITESRLGLLFNGLFKIPMQFLILFVGVMVFV